MENPVRPCTGARDQGGANFLLDVIPYRHSDAAQLLGWRSNGAGEALALTSENDFGTMYRGGFAPGVTFVFVRTLALTFTRTRTCASFTLTFLSYGWAQ